jgi:hypothetical protein
MLEYITFHAPFRMTMSLVTRSIRAFEGKARPQPLVSTPYCLSVNMSTMVLESQSLRISELALNLVSFLGKVVLSCHFAFFPGKVADIQLEPTGSKGLNLCDDTW